jgi:outer membrane immunogenic protein
MLRRLLGVVGASALLITLPGIGANAADMLFKAPPAAPWWNWSGYYVGINGGYGWNSMSGQTSCAACAILPTANLDPQGGVFGGQVGYNFQRERAVYGVEADFQGADIKDSAFFPNGFLKPPGGNFSASQRLDWFGTIRGRLGWAAWDRTLLYATGGLIYGHESISETTSLIGGGTNTAGNASIRAGGVVGAGLEHGFGRNLSAKVEALYYDMGSQTISSTAAGFTQSGVFSYRGAIIRGGLNWNLGGQGFAPAIAANQTGPLFMFAGPSPKAYDWTGYYGGVNVGGIFGHSDVASGLGVPFPVFTSNIGVIPFIITPAQVGTWPSTSGSAASVVGGGQAGYNWQSGQVVWGVEADFDGTGLREKSSSVLSRTTLSGTQTVTANFSANVDWIGTFRGRVGYAWERTWSTSPAVLPSAEQT